MTSENLLAFIAGELFAIACGLAIAAREILKELRRTHVE